jgi:hypothetical protein
VQQSSEAGVVKEAMQPNEKDAREKTEIVGAGPCHRQTGSGTQPFISGSTSWSAKNDTKYGRTDSNTRWLFPF